MTSPISGSTRIVLLACVIAALAYSAAWMLPATADEDVDAPIHHHEARFRWPLVPDPPVTRHFDPPATPFGPGHRGVDLAGMVGQRVHAAAGGVVIFSGQLAGRGVVSVDHGALRSTYEPLDPTVNAGDHVVAGDPIGTLAGGHAGCPTAACLHWGALRGKEYVDPLRLVIRAEIRLKPWAAVHGS